MENYLLALPPNRRKLLMKLRTSTHDLQIELGRHSRPKVPEPDRICRKCTSGEIENEYHAVMACSAHSEERNLVFEQIATIQPTFTDMDSLNQFLFIMSYGDGLAKIAKSIIPIVEKILE